MSMSLSLSSSSMLGGGGSSFSGGLGVARGGGARLGLGLGAGAGMGLGLGGVRLGIGGGGLGLGMGAGAGMGLGLGAGTGMGLGFGAGAGMGFGGGLGAGSGGALVASPAFAMGRAVASGGMSSGSALVVKPGAAPLMVLTRADEKTMLSGLNDRFSSYMAKVKALQQENATLEAKLSQLTGGTAMSPDTSSATSEEYEAQLTEYRNTLESLTLDTIKLEIDLDNIRATAHELKAKFDFEQGVKLQLETDILAMKKDIETASDLRIDLNAKQSSLKSELEFVTKTQIEELSSLHSKLGTTSTETSVSMIEVDTGKSFDIASALSKIRLDYEKTVQQHREEADAYYKLKMEEIQTATEKSTEAMSTTKAELSVSKKELQVLHLDLQGLISANLTLEQNLTEAQALSSTTVTDYHAQIASLESTIEVAKSELHKQIMSYQELLDIKLALDMEISTYKRLLDTDDLSMPDPGASSFLYSASPDPFSLLKSSVADDISSPDPSMEFTPEEPEKAQEEDSPAADSSAPDTGSPAPDTEAATEAQDSATEEQAGSTTHSEAEDSES